MDYPSQTQGYEPTDDDHKYKGKRESHNLDRSNFDLFLFPFRPFFFYFLLRRCKHLCQQDRS
jgi:hypothetical protein